MVVSKLSALPMTLVVGIGRIATTFYRRSRGFSIFQYSPCATWSVTGLRPENGSFGTASSTGGGGGGGGGGGSPREKEREERGPINIHIARALGSAFDISGGINARYPRADSSPRWALNIHQFPADICVTRALQPARRVSAIGNTGRALSFLSSREFLPRPLSLPSSSFSCSSSRKNARG